MKKGIFFKLAAMLFAVLCLTAATAFAQNSGTCGENATWEYDETTHTLTISGTGDMYDYSINSAPWNDIKNNIQTVIIKNGITRIGKYSFNDCTNLTSVTIPETVTSIGINAFHYCINLSLTIPETVTTIEKSAFEWVESVEYHGVATYSSRDYFWGACSLNGNSFIFADEEETILMMYVGKGGAVVVPEGVTTIGDGEHFCFALSLIPVSITLPESLTTIRDRAFSSVQENIDINCIYFKNDPDKLEWKGGWFDYPVKCFVYPETLSIWEEKFSGGNAIFAVNGVEYEQDGVVYILSDNGSATVFNHTAALPNELVIPATITKDGVDYKVRTIAQRTFYQCDNLTSVTIPEGVTSIGISAFYKCVNLTSVTIPEGVTTIGKEAFYYCRNLTSLTIPEGVTTIGKEAFCGCNKLTSLTIPESVTSIGAYAFCSVGVQMIYCHADPDQLELGDYSFSCVEQIHVPAEYLDKWHEKYASVTVIGDIKSIAGDEITIPTQTYTSSALTPVVKDGDKTLVEGEDYTITLPEGGCINAGEHTVILKGQKLYYKSVEKKFVINPVSVTATAENKTKIFGESNPTLTAKVEGLVNNESESLITYTLTRAEGENVGEYKITPSGDEIQGNYKVSFVEGKFTITPKALTADGISVADISTQTYTGSEIEPAITVKDGNTTLEKGTDYTVEYTDNTNAGLATVKITGKGNYSGNIEKTFVINPAPVTATDDITLSSVKIWSFNKTIFVENAAQEIVIVDMSGRIVKTIKPESSRTEIQLEKSGVYIVKTGIKTQKVSIQ